MSTASLIILLMTPLWNFLLHALCTRTSWGRPLPHQKLALFCCLLTAVLVTMAVGVTDFFLVQVGGDQLPFTCLVAVLFSHIYFHVFNMSETARRIRILVDLAQGKSTTEVYDDTSMVRVRIERLRGLGQIRMLGGRLYANRSWFTEVCRLVRWHERLLFPQRFGDRATRAWIGEPA